MSCTKYSRTFLWTSKMLCNAPISRRTTSLQTTRCRRFTVHSWAWGHCKLSERFQSVEVPLYISCYSGLATSSGSGESIPANPIAMFKFSDPREGQTVASSNGLYISVCSGMHTISLMYFSASFSPLNWSLVLTSAKLTVTNV